MRSDGQTPKWQCSIKNGDCLKRQSPFFKIRNFPVLQGLDQIQDAVEPVWYRMEHQLLKEAQDWSNRIYHISQAIYGGGQPSGEAHARLKEALYQRGIFSNALMRKPVLPLNQEEKDWVALGLERSDLPKVDMEQYKR